MITAICIDSKPFNFNIGSEFYLLAPMHILIQWKPDYELGLKEIDQHHNKLIDLINIVYNSVINERDSGIIEQVIEELTEYAFVHFKYEEKYFEKFDFEHKDSHIKEHQFFINKIRQIQGLNIHNDESSTQELLDFLKKWLDNHILHSDKKYVDCFGRNKLQ